MMLATKKSWRVRATYPHEETSQTTFHSGTLLATLILIFFAWYKIYHFNLQCKVFGGAKLTLKYRVGDPVKSRL